MAFDVNRTINLTDSIAQWFGANRWDLQPCVYTNNRGGKAIFFDVSEVLDPLSLAEGIPIAGEVVESAVGFVNALRNDNSLYQEALKKVTDSQNRKLVKYRIPNYNGGVVIDLGTDMRYITVDFMVWDLNYRSKLLELEEVFVNPDRRSTRSGVTSVFSPSRSNALSNVNGIQDEDNTASNLRVPTFRHPVLGTFDGAYIDNYEVVGSSDVYNAALVRVTFVITNPVPNYQETQKTYLINQISKWTAVAGNALASVNAAVSFAKNNFNSVVRQLSTPPTVGQNAPSGGAILPSLSRAALISDVLKSTPPNIKFAQTATIVNDMLGGSKNVPYYDDSSNMYKVFTSSGYGTPSQVDFIVSDYIRSAEEWKLVIPDEIVSLDITIGALRALARTQYRLYSGNLRIITTDKSYTLRGLAYRYGVVDLAQLHNMNYNSIRNANHIPAGVQIFLPSE